VNYRCASKHRRKLLWKLREKEIRHFLVETVLWSNQYGVIYQQPNYFYIGCLFRHMIRQRGGSVCMSVTLVHPVKALKRNEMPFVREIRVAPSKTNTVLDRGPGPLRKGRFGGSDLGIETSSGNLHCKLRPNGYSGIVIILYRNSATPYPTVPSPTPYDFPSPY